ncbi:uncharacterized protein EDB91DRAFT_1262869 [Suillus paluster]|uniref:uncharacterized protein n=1 Tax=Suillus paluster TaxID=48578 RepID=UPI001B870B93|nr:uncharacterized protein EDB91DRAFT_1262869 [Suillus paluster]KAG1747798.1 hypothetical protein EDB91DRAFT_1262869 [Suillus paluster]
MCIATVVATISPYTYWQDSEFKPFCKVPVSTGARKRVGQSALVVAIVETEEGNSAFRTMDGGKPNLQAKEYSEGEWQKQWAKSVCRLWHPQRRYVPTFARESVGWYYCSAYKLPNTLTASIWYYRVCGHLGTCVFRFTRYQEYTFVTLAACSEIAGSISSKSAVYYNAPNFGRHQDAVCRQQLLATGATWDVVYRMLEKYGVNVVGGKVTGVGVGGIVLGGGYSYLTNQYGLAIDNVVAYELVLPNGTVTTVTSSSNPDLFFGLRIVDVLISRATAKGGFNNFGIVTYVTLKTYPQSQVWGGSITYDQDQLKAVKAAIAKFSANVIDPKAAMYSIYKYVSGKLVVSCTLFYNAPTYPDGIFDDFLAIPHVDGYVSTRSFTSMIKNELPSTPDLRAVINVIAIEEWTESLLDDVAKEILALPHFDLRPHRYAICVGRIHVNEATHFLALFYAWNDSSNDDLVYDSVTASSNYMKQLAIAAGQDVGHVVVYPNNADPSTSIEEIYGDNLARLQDIKKAVDPNNVMGLAGGWKI